MHISVVPAEPNTRVIYDMDGTLEAIDLVVAWRVVTDGDDADDLQTIVSAITPDGDAADMKNAVGVQHANGSVTIYAQAVYASLEEAQAGYQ